MLNNFAISNKLPIASTHMLRALNNSKTNVLNIWFFFLIKTLLTTPRIWEAFLLKKKNMGGIVIC